MGLWMAKKKDVLVNLHIKEILSYLHIIKSFKQLLWICTTVPKVFGNCNVMKNLNKNQQSKNLKTIHQNKKGTRNTALTLKCCKIRTIKSYCYCAVELTTKTAKVIEYSLNCLGKRIILIHYYFWR